ncbi:hypothetical protein NA78x_005769 [Anatilimnocola sp. NA78]|uniref:hypothetical protein n=1 Tax=Anatilimnocola sp. NA78 TaxID=3415683 RepID=UPI003CE47814
MFSTLTLPFRLTAGAVLVVALLGLAGCGNSGPQVVPVSGVVLIDGAPLSYGHIQVIPTGWRPASGSIGADGRFTLTTNVQGDGVAVGTHKVAILAGESITTDLTKWHAPKRYSDIKTSELTATITGPTSDLKIELMSDGTQTPEKKVREGGTENSGFQFN